MTTDTSDDIFAPTPLKPVTDWGWAKYIVKYWRDETHSESSDEPLKTRFCIESDAHVENFIFETPPPRGCDWVTWDVVEENVKHRLRFVTGHGLGGTRVDGAGWVDE